LNKTRKCDVKVNLEWSQSKWQTQVWRPSLEVRQIPPNRHRVALHSDPASPTLHNLAI